MLQKHPASTKRVRKDHEACRQVAYQADQSESFFALHQHPPRSQGSPLPLGFEDVMLARPRPRRRPLPAVGMAALLHGRDRGPQGQPYVEVAYRVSGLRRRSLDELTFRRLIGDAYASFETPEVAPLKALGDVTPEDGGLQSAELFHGPTLPSGRGAAAAGRMLDHTLTTRRPAPTIARHVGRHRPAAIERCATGKTIDVFMLFPRGRVERGCSVARCDGAGAQRAQCRHRGHVDDCQDLAKACFNDLASRDCHALTRR